MQSYTPHLFYERKRPPVYYSRLHRPILYTPQRPAVLTFASRRPSLPHWKSALLCRMKSYVSKVDMWYMCCFPCMPYIVWFKAWHNQHGVSLLFAPHINVRLCILHKQ
jgi:hypothetical protein